MCECVCARARARVLVCTCAARDSCSLVLSLECINLTGIKHYVVHVPTAFYVWMPRVQHEQVSHCL